MTRKTRDFTQSQFDRRIANHGFVSQGFLGYYKLPGTNTEVSVWNAGPRRRDQLAYLLAELDKKRRSE